MNKIVYQLLIENKKPIIFTILGIVISIILIKLTIETSYYLAFLSFPITIIAVILLVATTIHIARTHREFISKEENLPDGSYKKYYNDSKQVKQAFTIKNGKRQGPSLGYYMNGQLNFEINYEKGVQTGETISYNASNIIVRKSEYLNDEYQNKCTEYYECGNIRMIQNKSKYTFFDQNGILRCEIHIQPEIITRDEYRANRRNYWYKLHWNEDTEAIYKPIGVWKEFNESGILILDLNFNNYDMQKYKDFNVQKTCYDPAGTTTLTEFISPEELYIERFAANFSQERLIDKKARYRIMHINPGGWIYKEFSIPPILSIGDIIKINNTDNLVDRSAQN